jgi:hypothetical protein
MHKMAIAAPEELREAGKAMVTALVARPSTLSRAGGVKS